MRYSYCTGEAGKKARREADLHMQKRLEELQHKHIEDTVISPSLFEQSKTADQVEAKARQLKRKREQDPMTKFV